MEALHFNILQIIEDSKTMGERFVYPISKTFEDIHEDFHVLIDGIYYEVIVNKTSSYIWLSFDYGKPNPRDEHLTNIITGEKRDNEREITEAELIQQFFCLYHFGKELFYISNIKKKSIILSVLKKETNMDFELKTIKKTKQEFLDIIRNVNKITFTEARHLFNQNSKKRQALIDLSGTDAPEEFTIEALYNNPNAIVGFIQELFTEQENNKLKDLVIRGKDENDFEIIFNNDTFSRKIEIKTDKDENGKYIPDNVKENLLKELEK